MRAQQEPPLRDWSGEKWYRVQNEFMDALAPRVGVFAIAVYHLLCRHARNDRISRKSIAQMAKDLDCGRTKLIETLATLERHNAIRRVRRAGEETDYELLDLRHSANRTPQNPKAESVHQSATRTGRVRHADQRCSRGERPIRKERLQDHKTPIPPTPLSKGGDSRTLSVDEAEKRGQEFKCALKRELYDVPLNAPHLATDDYDRYFRDVNFIETGEGPVIVETADLERTKEGLHKYKARLAKIGSRVFERQIQFEMVCGGDAE